MAINNLFPENPRSQDTLIVDDPSYQNAVKSGDAAQVIPLRFYDVYQDIAIELPEQPNINIIRAEVNKVIRRVNDEIGLWRQIVNVSPSAITVTIELMTTNNIEDETDDEIEDYGRFNHGWLWSKTNNSLRLDDTVVEVEEVYLDDEEWELVTYPVIKNSNNSSEKYWCQIGRFIFFPKDLATTSEIIKIKCKKSYSFIENIVNKDAIIDLPESYRQLLISGVLYSITARPRWKDEGVMNVNKEIFDMELFSLQNQYANLEATYAARDMVYKY
jgi:hypothetical protein